MRVNLDGIIFILQLQQLLPALVCHQLAVVNDICTPKVNDTILIYVSNRQENHTDKIDNLN